MARNTILAPNKYLCEFHDESNVLFYVLSRFTMVNEKKIKIFNSAQCKKWDKRSKSKLRSLGGFVNRRKKDASKHERPIKRA